MKILLIYNRYRYSGGEDTYFASLCNLLRSRGHSVIEYTKSSDDIPNNVGARIQTGLGLFVNNQMTEELTEIIKTHRPEIAQVQNIYPLMNPSLYRLFHSFSIPIIQRISNYRYLCPKMSLFRDGKICTECIGKKIMYPSMIHGCYNNSRLASTAFSLSHWMHSIRGAYDHIDAFLFPSEYARTLYTTNAEVPQEKTYVVPSFYQEPEKKRTIRNDGKYILFVGRLTEEKGIDLLLETMESIPHIRLLVIGDGPMKRRVLHASEQKGNIVYKGHLPKAEIISYMRRSQFVVTPSKWYDVLPNVLIESFANKKAVVAPCFGVFEDLVEDGKTGLHYEYNNKVDLGDKIKRLYDDESLTKILGENAYSEYERQYTSERHYKNLMSLYETILSHKAAY